MTDDRTAYATVISAAELVARDDPQGELLLIAGSELPQDQLRDAALEVFVGWMSGTPLEELRADIHRLGRHIGAGDRQVVLNLEAVGLLQATAQGDGGAVCVLISGSEFTPFDHCHVIVALVGQAIAGWVGPDGVPGVFAALRREWVGDAT